MAMPKAPEPVDPILAAFEDLVNSPEWRRSRRGNLWRVWEGMTLTVFARKDGFYGWCIADDKGTRFSSAGYPTEGEALEALAAQVLG